MKNIVCLASKQWGGGKLISVTEKYMRTNKWYKIDTLKYMQCGIHLTEYILNTYYQYILLIYYIFN